jgi:glycosyltransferase involved in cell wall biosynthesis
MDGPHKEIPEPVREALRHTTAIIPVWNEEAGIGGVLDDIPEGVTPIVVDNGSEDRTVEIATAKGGIVIHEEKKGYGNVCLAGIRAIPEKAPQTRYVVFIDGDHADHPEELPDMLRYLVDGEADMVLASRVTGAREKGALPIQSRFAIWYARRLLWRLYRVRFTDIGPFRVMPLEVLHRLHMEDPTWGWTVEMQAKGARLKLRMKEVPGRYRKRPGASKISGAFWTAIKAGWKVLTTVVKWRFKRLRPPVGAGGGA